jgi:hypothetical protein
MLGRLASATDAQQPQAPHRFVFLQSLAYTGRFRLVLHWQVTVSSDHLYGAETARGQICVVCKKDSYFSRIGAYGPLGRAASSPPSQIPVRLPSTLPMLRAPEIAGCGADRARERGGHPALRCCDAQTCVIFQIAVYVGQGLLQHEQQRVHLNRSTQHWHTLARHRAVHRMCILCPNVI